MASAEKGVPSEPMSEQKRPPIIPLPFELPPNFLESLGYRRDQRLVAAFWEPAGDELTLRDDRWAWCGAHHWPFLDWRRQPVVQQWLRINRINLGNSEEPATHWLLIDRDTDQGFIATQEEAYKRIKQQRMEKVG
jgi:hypothetical protein